MKKISFCLLASVAMLMLGACGHDHSADELGHHHHHHEEGEAHELGSEISLSPEAAAKFGVKSDTIKPSTFAEVIKTTGQVLNSPGSSSVVTAPTSGVVQFTAGIQVGKSVGSGVTVATVKADNISGGDRNRADQAAMNAAKRELDRLTPLYEEGIVSQKDYNAAKEAYEIAKSQYSPSAASGVARTVSAGVITDLLVQNGQYVEAGAPIATVSAARRLTLRADVPDKYYNALPLITNARIGLPYAEGTQDILSLNGKRVSSSDASMRIEPGYMPVYFEFDNNGALVPGTLVDVYLLGQLRTGVISVPREAVVEQQGKYYVFRQLDEDCYEKLPVVLGQTDGDSYEVKSGLEGGEYIVTSGATAVRLAESSSVVPEGHSHSH